MAAPARFLVVFASVVIVAVAPVGAQVIVDNDDGPPAYTETGTWTTSSSTGYNGGTYRFATPGSSSTATWTGNLPAAGDYEIFVWYVPGTNRATAAKYDVAAADQTYSVYVDQTAGGYAWDSLGSFSFNAGDNTITLDAAGSSGGTVVIADAVRFGGGGDPTCTLESTTEVAPAVYHHVYTCPAPQVLHVLEFDLDDPQYTVDMGFAQGQRNYTTKQTTSHIASLYDSYDRPVIGAINASHFDAGLFIHGMQGSNGNIIGLPTLTWPRESYVLQESTEAFVTTNTPVAVPVVRFADAAELPVDVLNYTCTTNTLAIWTPDWGPTTGSTAEGVEVIVEDVNYPFRPNKWVTGRITAVRTGASSVNNPIPADGFVLGACPGMEAELLSHVSVGEQISAYVGLEPPDLINAKLICGGCSGWLVKDGAPFPENWIYGHAPERHPRTVLAWSGTQHWFVTCDGRQPGYSVGMTYTEMADFLVSSLQAEHAVNLDGGGSTTMVIDGSVVNCPSDGATTPCTGTERAVPNVLLLVQRDPDTPFPLSDDFPSGGRSLAWDDKFSVNPVVPFAPSAPGGDGHVMEVLTPAGGHETASLGSSGDVNYTVSASVYCEYRPEVSGNGFERVGLFARDNGNANFESTALGGGNCYALTFDSHDGRIRAGVVNDGVFTDFLAGGPLYNPTTAWRTFQIGCFGSEIEYRVDGVAVASVVDTTHSRGRFGIGYHEYFANDANMHGTRADNFLAFAYDFDWDNDGDVDLTDFTVFCFCMQGPGVTYLPGHMCLEMDGDSDSDVDLTDFGTLQMVFTGDGG